MTTTIAADTSPAAPAAVPRSPMTIGWIIRRALLGLCVMFAVTGIAAYIAHASIDPDVAVEELAIGAPAAPLLLPEAAISELSAATSAR